jgi:hypothetical protein
MATGASDRTGIAASGLVIRFSLSDALCRVKYSKTQSEYAKSSSVSVAARRE